MHYGFKNYVAAGKTVWRKISLVVLNLLFMGFNCLCSEKNIYKNCTVRTRKMDNMMLVCILIQFIVTSLLNRNSVIGIVLKLVHGIYFFKTRCHMPIICDWYIVILWLPFIFFKQEIPFILLIIINK